MLRLPPPPPPPPSSPVFRGTPLADSSLVPLCAYPIRSFRALQAHETLLIQKQSNASGAGRRPRAQKQMAQAIVIGSAAP